MMNHKISIMLILVVLTIAPHVNAATLKNDVRVVIDVSGSMKKSDPHNLRIPAIKLLNGLLPDNSDAGVWTFGRFVNMTVKWGKVDKAWRKRADKGAAKIHSNGLYTNIESALSRSTRGWEKLDVNTRRSVILLTDGRVDISKDKEKNEASRQAVLTQSIEKLKDSGARIHAIALSKDTDETLLRQLALETDGSFEIAQSAEELQKIFFKLFERATDPDTIELDGNQFTVDKSIKEMTLLVFRPKDSKPTILYPPVGPKISTQKKGESSWRSEDGFDLITIAKPVPGVWKIDAYVDADNRLMVVTDLTLNVSGVPAYTTPAQAVTIRAELHNKASKISKNSFLRFVAFELNHINDEDTENQLALTHTNVREDKGQYLHSLEDKLTEGRHSFIVTADSRTFSRSKRIYVEVQWPVKVEIQSTATPGTYLLTVEAREEYLKPQSLKPVVQIEDPAGKQQALPLKQVSGVWQAEVKTGQDGIYKALIKVSAESIAGQEQQHDLGAFSMIGVYLQAGSEPQPEPHKTDDLNLEATEASLPEAESEESWMRIFIIASAVNLLLILIGIAAVYAYRRNAKKMEFALDNDLVSDSDLSVD
ncbi:MAG: hypothetical protein ACI9KN_002317 [Gammaproteobacteria bacterium]|jgi:uncharacterized protein (TIGR03503 family)